MRVYDEGEEDIIVCIDLGWVDGSSQGREGRSYFNCGGAVGQWGRYPPHAQGMIEGRKLLTIKCLEE